jgi:DUF1009 family protein
VGLIAGAGRFPLVFLEKAQELKIPVVCIGVAGMADPAVAAMSYRFHWLKRMAMGSIIRNFRREGVVRWTMAGKFHKHILFQPWKWLRLLPDFRAARFWLSRLRLDNKDDTLLTALIQEFRKDGLECVSALDLCPELLVRSGFLTRRQPTAREQADIEFGWILAREMGRLDVGQSVMVRERAVLAVEAIEGTDQAILRAGTLCGGAGFTVVKIAKPKQDMRFDVPTVGPTTIETMRQAGAQVLAIEAGRTIILDEAETIARADQHRIAIVALTDPNPQ